MLARHADRTGTADLTGESAAGGTGAGGGMLGVTFGERGGGGGGGAGSGLYLSSD